MRLDLLLIIRLHNAAPQVLATVREYFLQCAVTHVDFIVHGIGDSMLCCVGYCLCKPIVLSPSVLPHCP
jgi:hypothetical protein